MKISRWLKFAAIVLPLSLAALPASAQKVDPDKLPKINCTDIVYAQSFLKANPKAPAGCLEARVYKGVKYAKFNCKVVTPGSDVITVALLNVAGDPLTNVTFKPSPAARLIVNGKTEAWGELQKGDQVTVWVSEKRFDFYTGPGSSASRGTATAAAQ
jgi:hypothetical protein